LQSLFTAAIDNGTGRSLKEAPDFFVVSLQFLALRVHAISRFGERFGYGQYGLVSFLFAVL